MKAGALLLAVNLIVLLAFALAVYGGMMRYNGAVQSTITYEQGVVATATAR